MQYRLTVQYDGTNFLGWQLQPQGPTIQGELERAVERLFGVVTRVTGAGRTDAGVHALGQVACFRAAKVMEPAAVQRALNALTPPDIAISEVTLVGDDFDPRRRACSRIYQYRIWTRQWRSPFWNRYTWHVRVPLDVTTMAAAAARLLGEHDFSSFQAADCDAESAVRRIIRSEVQLVDGQLLYTVEATAFLRHMVRNLVGTLVEVGNGARRLDEFSALLGLRDRRRAGATAPARGLCLTEVRYPETSPAELKGVG